MRGLLPQFLVVMGNGGPCVGRIVMSSPMYAVYHDGEKEVWRRVNSVDEGYKLLVDRLPSQYRQMCGKIRSDRNSH